MILAIFHKKSWLESPTTWHPIIGRRGWSFHKKFQISLEIFHISSWIYSKYSTSYIYIHIYVDDDLSIYSLYIYTHISIYNVNNHNNPHLIPIGHSSLGDSKQGSVPAVASRQSPWLTSQSRAVWSSEEVISSSESGEKDTFFFGAAQWLRGLPPS